MIKRIDLLFIACVLLCGLLVAGCGGKSGGGGNHTTTSGGYPGMDLVAGGVVMSSESYRLVLTTGQGPGGNGVMTSESYRLQGGLVGTTE